ncbi:MAG: hypothetical protein ACE5HF_05485 [Gemmatimonadota bacterium]
MARFNPPDSLRLDLFTSGEVAMAVSLSGGAFRTEGEIDDVVLPSLPFMYAMAGLYEPDWVPTEGYEAGDESVLVLGEGDTRTYFFLLEDRLTKLEQRVNGRLRRRVRVNWAPDTESWPSSAEYRDFDTPSRVRWRVESVTPVPGGNAPEIYEIPGAR